MLHNFRQKFIMLTEFFLEEQEYMLTTMYLKQEDR